MIRQCLHEVIKSGYPEGELSPLLLLWWPFFLQIFLLIGAHKDKCVLRFISIAGLWADRQMKREREREREREIPRPPSL